MCIFRYNLSLSTLVHLLVFKEGETRRDCATLRRTTTSYTFVHYTLECVALPSENIIRMLAKTGSGKFLVSMSRRRTLHKTLTGLLG